MFTAIVKRGFVVNVTVGEPDPKDPEQIICPEGTGIGWLYDGTAFKSPPELETQPAPAKG